MVTHVREGTVPITVRLWQGGKRGTQQAGLLRAGSTEDLSSSLLIITHTVADPSALSLGGYLGH